jgi:hypothetical protein
MQLLHIFSIFDHNLYCHYMHLLIRIFNYVFSKIYIHKFLYTNIFFLHASLLIEKEFQEILSI